MMEVQTVFGRLRAAGLGPKFSRRCFKMAHKINDACISCGACTVKDVCPVEGCITADDPIYVINADTCIDCGNCVKVCPVDAIEA